MTSLPERLLVVRPQWEAQLDAFSTLTARALDSTEQLLALNMKTSRASIEQATGTLQQMLHATHPRDLLAIGTQAQGQWQQVFSYSRELMGIAMGARQRSWGTLPVHEAPALLPAPVLQVLTQTVEQSGIAVADATTVTGEIVTAAAESNAALAEDTLGVGDQSEGGDGADTGLAPAGQIEPAAASVDVADETPAEMPAETSVETPTELDAEKTGAAPSEVPGAASDTAQSASAVLDEETSANLDALVDIVIADDVPPGKTKPLVEALNQVVPKPASAEHPIISTVPLEAGAHVELPLVTPAQATPPVQLSNGPAPAEGRRNTRKKS
jgi:hypothetical protein